MNQYDKMFKTVYVPMPVYLPNNEYRGQHKRKKFYKVGYVVSPAWLLDSANGKSEVIPKFHYDRKSQSMEYQLPHNLSSIVAKCSNSITFDKCDVFDNEYECTELVNLLNIKIEKENKRDPMFPKVLLKYSQESLSFEQLHIAIESKEQELN